MKYFFAHNLDFIFLFYGAAFIFFATACLVLYFREKTRRILPWFWLSAFGFLHGVNEWLDMLAISFMNPQLLWQARTFFLLVSYLCLVEFSRRSWAILYHRKFSLFWAYVPMTVIILGFYFQCRELSCLPVLIRYFAGLTAGLGIACILWNFRIPGGSDVTPRFYRGLAFVFFLYALASGLVVPRAPVLLAPFLNDVSFLESVHIPIQFFRGLLASLIAFLFIYKATKITFYVYGKGRSVAYLKVMMGAFLAIYLACLYGGFRLVSWVEYYENNHQNRMILSDARLVVEGLREADIEALLQASGKVEYSRYRQFHRRTATLTGISRFIKSIYLISIKDGKPNFVAGSQGQVFPGDIVPSFGKNVPEKFILDAFYSKQSTLAGPYVDNRGGESFSVFVPLEGAGGQIVGLLGLDVVGFEVQSVVMRFRFFSLLIILGFLLLLIIGYSFLIGFALKSLELEVQKNNLDKALQHLKETESELAKSDETFRGILSNSPSAIFGFDHDLRAIYWNQGAQNLYGFSKDEVVNEKDPFLSKKVTDIFGEGASSLGLERIFSGETLKFELSHGLQGRRVDVIMTLFPVKDPQGHILFGMGLVQDISEHKILEMQVVDERNRLRTIATSIGAGLSLVDRNFKILWVNEPLEKWFGKLDSIQGKTCYETYQFKHAVCEGCPVQKAFETGATQTGEQQVSFPDGRLMNFLLICSPIKDERGDVAQVLELTLDITDRRKMVELLEYERALSKNVVNSINDSLMVLDCKDRRILEVNRKFLEDYQMTRQEVIGKRCDEIGEYLSLPCKACEFDEVAIRGNVATSTHTHRGKNGDEIYLDITLAPLKNEKGEIIGVIHLSRDVTERKRLEEELRHYSGHLEQLVKERTLALQKSELMFRRLFETSQDGILVIEAATGCIVDVNPFLLNLLECSRDDMQNVHYSGIAHMLDSRIFEKMFEDLRSRLSVVYDEVHLRTCTARPITVEFHASIYYVDDKKIIQCNVRDITERKRLEKIKSEFVSMVSHELRTPLSAIKEGVEIVADGTQGGLNTGQLECLQIALSNIKRLNRLIGDILDISKIQSNLLKVHISPCSVRNLIDHVYSLVKIEIEKRGMQFVLDVQENLPSVQGDRDRLIQVLMNLLNNAVKFTHENSRIMLSAHRRGDFIEFAVMDEGEGIPHEELSRLFGKFVQLDSTLVRRVGGTGLGLYISKNLVEAMGGQIWVESEMGHGSVFKFTIPVNRD